MSNFQEAVSRFPIVSWADENLRNVRAGHEEIKADCPLCGGQRTLSINRHKMLFCCHRCPVRNPDWRRKGTNLLQFMVLLGQDKGEAFRTILRLSGLPDREIAARRTGQPLIPPGAIPLSTLPDTEPARQLLVARHVPHLIPVSYVCVEGYYKDRVILQCLERDELKGSECKSLFRGAQFKSLFHPPGQFEKSKTVYTTRAWNHSSKTAVVTESILDAETFSGVANGIGLYGSELSEGQVFAMLSLGIEEVVWALDGDAHDKVLKAFRKWGCDLFDNSMIRFGERDDPNSVGTEGCKKLLADRIPVTSEWDLFSAALTWGKW